MHPTDSPAGLRDRLFAAFARRYPTERMTRSRLLKTVWRAAVKVARPCSPFRMRTPYYEFMAVPQGESLTRAVIRDGCWERPETEVMLSFLRPGSTAIDIGANFGNYALAAARAVGPQGRVYAFEPHPRTFLDLERNAALVPERNLTAVNAAVGDESGRILLYGDQANPGGHSLFREATTREGEAIAVDLVNLVDFCEQRKAPRPIRLIKIDAQGAEARILRGALPLIEADRPVILMEFWPSMLAKNGEDPLALLQRLERLGYAIEVLADKKRNPTSPIEAVEWGYRTTEVDLVLAPPVS